MGAGGRARERRRDRCIAGRGAARLSSNASAHQQGRRRLMMWSAAVASVTAIAIGTLFYVRSTASEVHLYVTAIGEQRTVMLPDESRIALNTSSRVRVTYRRSSRLIELEQGEATFSVAHDASRPFDVVAAHGTTRAIGTEFNVLTGSSGVTVSVLSGTVAITPPARASNAVGASAVRLTRGEEITYSNELVSEVQPLNANRIQAWHAGRIAFEDLPLRQALAEFNRYTRTPIVVRGTSLANLRSRGRSGSVRLKRFSRRCTRPLAFRRIARLRLSNCRRLPSDAGNYGSPRAVNARGGSAPWSLVWMVSEPCCRPAVRGVNHTQKYLCAIRLQQWGLRHGIEP